MSTTIMRGSTCRLKFKILNDVDVSTLGEPYVAITQEYATLTPGDEQINVDVANNCVNIDLDENDTMALVENATTQCQLAFTNTDVETGTSTVIRFPVHELYVTATLFGNLL